MSDISPVGRLEGLILERVGKVSRVATQKQDTPSRGRDNVELSDHALFLSRTRDLPDVRQDLVDHVKAQIEAGTYDTPDRLDAAIDNLLEDLS